MDHDSWPLKGDSWAKPNIVWCNSLSIKPVQPLQLQDLGDGCQAVLALQQEQVRHAARACTHGL